MFPLPVVMAGETRKKIRIGVISDVHKDIMPNADDRLRAFIETMNTEKVDAVIQLGDFCQPLEANKDFLGIFNSFRGPRYHVLGNHDMDGNATRQQTVAFWGMKERYYSFDLGGCHFVVLDSNDKPEGWQGGYSSFIADDQIAWLKEDLAATDLNTFIFSHHSLERPTCITSQEKVRKVLEESKTNAGGRKVAGCFNGHWHIDHHRIIEEIPYVHINSASYFWMGSDYKHERLPEDLAAKYPLLALTAPYQGPLFTILEIDPASGRFTIASRESEWEKPSPADLGFQKDGLDPDWVRPAIREVKI